MRASLRRRRPAQGPGRAAPTSRSCSSPTSSPPATWARRCATSSRATWSRSGAAARSASSPSRAPTCSAPSASSPSTASRTACGWRARRSGAETHQLRGGRSVLETLKEMTGGRGPDACIDAVGMEAHGHGPAVRLRPGQAGVHARNRPPHRAARGDPRLPQRRHRLGHRRLRRLHRQVPDGRGDEPLAHHQDRPVPRAALHEAAARARPDAAKSTPASSSRTTCRSRTRRAATRCSGTRKTTARRSSSSRISPPPCRSLPLSKCRAAPSSWRRRCSTCL